MIGDQDSVKNKLHIWSHCVYYVRPSPLAADPSIQIVSELDTMAWETKHWRYIVFSVECGSLCCAVSVLVLVV